MSRNSRLLSSATFLLFMILIPPESQPQSALTLLDWGIEQKAIYKETIATAEQNRAVSRDSTPGDRLYRYFTATDMHDDVTAYALTRHWPLWKEFKETGSALTNERYGRFLQDRDPTLLSTLRAGAPRLYFDFIGDGDAEYVLTDIHVVTIHFYEYAGGGFADQEAWYDIVVPHSPGERSYKVDRKLRFRGSGRAVLRLWSDNFYSSAGLTPQGCFLMRISFRFLVNGDAVDVTTPDFKIDI